jgi:HNH endonuclease
MARWTLPKVLLSPPIEDEMRFWSMVDRSRGNRACWPWLGPRDGDGYGRYTDRYGQRAAHRAAYALSHDYAFGRLLHTCGNRACCNPRHLQEEPEAPWRPRFWAKVARCGPVECWNWSGARTRGGYGVLRVDGKTRYAHHLAWELANGRRWDDDQRPIRHTCGNRGCVNPAHLELGEPPNAGKLDEYDVAVIRERRAAGEPQSRLAKAYRISPSMVSRIVDGSRWGWTFGWDPREEN